MFFGNTVLKAKFLSSLGNETLNQSLSLRTLSLEDLFVATTPTAALRSCITAVCTSLVIHTIKDISRQPTNSSCSATNVPDVELACTASKQTCTTKNGTFCTLTNTHRIRPKRCPLRTTLCSKVRTDRRNHHFSYDRGKRRPEGPNIHGKPVNVFCDDAHRRPHFPFDTLDCIEAKHRDSASNIDGVDTVFANASNSGKLRHGIS